MAIPLTDTFGFTPNKPNIDKRYLASNGQPYASVAAAETALASRLVETCIGLTVLVADENDPDYPKAKEYWVQPKGTTPETYGLVEKGAGTTDYADLDNKPTISDGGQGSAQIPLAGNVKVTATAATSGQTGVTVTAENGGITMAFTLEKGTDGVNGKSAYQQWLDEGNTGDETDFLNSLKAQIGKFIYAGYNATAAALSIGGTTTENLAADATDDSIVLMPNDDATAGTGNPTATMMFSVSVSDDPTPVTTYTYIGDVNVDASNFLSSSSVDSTNLKNPTMLQVAKASDVMGLKAKLEGVTASETKATMDNQISGYINGDGAPVSVSAGSTSTYVVIPLNNAKGVRLWGSTNASTGTNYTSYAFWNAATYVDSNTVVEAHNWDVREGSVNYAKEYNLNVPEGATHIAVSLNTSTNQPNFYCYLQSGESVIDMIPAPFAIESVGEYISAKKISSTGVVSSATTLANLVLKVDVTGRDGETLLLSGTCFATGGGNSYAWWSFKGANNEQLDVSGTVNTRTNYERVPVTVPTGAVTLYVIGTTQTGDVLPQVEYLEGVSGDAVRAVITDATPLVGEVTKDRLDSAGQVQSASSTTNRLMKIDVSECVGKTLELTGVIIANSSSSVTYSWWAIHDEYDNVLSHSGEYPRARATMTDVRVVVPTGAKWLYVFGSNKETSDKEPQSKLLGELRQTAIEEAEKVHGEKELKVLCFGNSYTLDSFQYLPFILKSMYPKLKLTLGIGYIGACPIVQHVVNLDSQSRTCLGTTYTPTNYTYYKYTGFGRISNGVAYTAEKMLADEKWDLIVTHQSSEHSWEDYDVTYDPYINDFCRLLSGMVGYNFKLGFVLTHSSRTATKAELVSRYETVVANTREVMETMPFDVIFPYGTAIQSCRTNDDLYSIYGTTAMCGDSPTPVHLCDGFPCLVANYTNALALLNMLGLSSVGIVGEQTRPNLTWCNNHGIQGMNYPNGATLEVTDRLAYYAQMAAINAVKKPYEVTDMSGYDVEEPQEEA